MSYDIKGIENERRVVLEVRHVGERTTITADLIVHVSRSACGDPERVALVDLDVRWVRAASVPALTDELARVLERIAAGLREGPGGLLLDLTPSPLPTP